LFTNVVVDVFINSFTFYFKNGSQCDKFIVVDHELTYFVMHEAKCKKSYTENKVIGMLEFLIDNIFV